jgi:hypothetical protein
VPWWLSHTASLFWTFTVRGDGLPDVSRAAGIGIAVLYFGCATFVHARQSMRGAVAHVAEWLGALSRRARLILNSIRRQGVKNWVMAHLNEYLGVPRP